MWADLEVIVALRDELKQQLLFLVGQAWLHQVRLVVLLLPVSIHTWQKINEC
jgi:hypothetical protein